MSGAARPRQALTERVLTGPKERMDDGAEGGRRALRACAEENSRLNGERSA